MKQDTREQVRLILLMALVIMAWLAVKFYVPRPDFANYKIEEVKRKEDQ